MWGEGLCGVCRGGEKGGGGFFSFFFFFFLFFLSLVVRVLVGVGGGWAVGV